MYFVGQAFVRALKIIFRWSLMILVMFLDLKNRFFDCSVYGKRVSTQRRSSVCTLHQYSIIHKTWQLTSAVILGRLHILDLADPLTRLRPPQLRLSVSLVWCGLVREHLFAACTMTCKSRTTRTSPVHAEGCTVMESAASRVVHHRNHATHGYAVISLEVSLNLFLI